MKVLIMFDNGYVHLYRRVEVVTLMMENGQARVCREKRVMP